MPSLFWIEVVAYATYMVISTALALMVLGVGPRRVLNRLFALFTVAGAVWAVSALFLRITLWLQMGSPAFWLELAAVALNLMSPVLLLFSVRYAGHPTRWADRAAALGLIAIALLSIPVFSHQMLFDPHLDVNGMASYAVSPLGHIVPLVAVFYFGWSFLLLWRGRRQTGESYLAFSVLMLLAGFVVGGILRPYFPYPVLSITVTASVAVLGCVAKQGTINDTWTNASTTNGSTLFGPITGKNTICYGSTAQVVDSTAILC